MTLLHPSFAILFAIVAYYFFQKYAHSFGLVDIPNSRSSHTKPTVRGFGVVIFLSVFLVAVFWSPLFVAQNTFFFMSMFLAMIVGLVDDVRGSAPRIKITIFILISLLLMTDGYLISSAGVYLGVNIEIVYVISICDNKQIDKYGIQKANNVVLTDSIQKLDTGSEKIYVDHFNIDLLNVTSLTRGEDKSIAIALASIMAKVSRDNYMVKMSEKYPEYDFANNKGYGTLKHRQAIQKYGLTDLHRTSFNLMPK